MLAEVTIFDVMRVVLVIVSPFILLEGLFLLLLNQNAYARFETVLSKEFGLKKRILPVVESNVYTFHTLLLKKKTLIGLLCVLCAVIFFLVNK